MTNKYKAIFLDEVSNFIDALGDQDKAKILASVKVMMEGDFQSIIVKSLKSPIRELAVKKYRILFFIDRNVIYLIGAFIKKTAKTPKKEIENAEKIHKIIMKINKNNN